MNERDIAWSAGLFEGEGTFFFNNQGKYAAGVRVQMTDLDCLQRLQGFFGGIISVSYEAKGTWKKCYNWRLNVVEAEKFIIVVYPYLMSRRKARADDWLKARSAIKNKVTKKDLIADLGKDGLSQRDIATKVGCSQAYVSMILK